MKVILASNSPRRKELIREIFDSFDVITQNVEEISDETRPSRRAVELAKLKLGRLPSEYKDALIISADTLVYKSGKFYGKPENRERAAEILRELSGKKHYVYTGVAVYYDGKYYTFYDRSEVVFKQLGEKEIDEYISTGSPMDKAGAYGIQDRQVVESYKGSYSNIVGLPVEKLKKLIRKILRA